MTDAEIRQCKPVAGLSLMHLMAYYEVILGRKITIAEAQEALHWWNQEYARRMANYNNATGSRLHG